MLGRLLFPIILVFFTFSQGSAQNYLKTLSEGKVWEVAWPQGMGSITYQSYCLQGDTILSGQRYFQVKRPNGNLLGFAREDTALQRVFFREMTASVEELLIDYQLQPGDSFSYAGFVLRVDSVGKAFLYGNSRKVVYFNSFQSFIEGVGHSFYGIIKDSQYKYVSAIRDEACTNDPPFSPKVLIRVFPNPVCSTLTVTLPKALTKPCLAALLDVNGRKVNHWEVRESRDLDLGDLPKGLYYLKIDNAIIKLRKE